MAENLAAANQQLKPVPHVRLLVIILGVVAFLALLYFACSFFLAPRKQQAEPVIALPVMSCARVVSKVLDRVDELPGEIQAYQDVAIYPKVPGFIEWIGVDRGSVVKQGQVMVRMYAPEYIARRNESLAKVEEAKSRLAEAESRLVSVRARLKEDIAIWQSDESTYARLKAASLTPGVVASNDVVVLAQQVQADAERVTSLENKVKASESEVVALRDSLAAARRSADNFRDFASYLNITAPFDGYITTRNMHVGSFVGPLGNGAYPAIVRIAELTLLRIVVPVPEYDTAGILPGAQVEFSVSSHPDKRFVGTVARIANSLDQSTRTMPVELNFSNPGYEVFPGAFCKIYWPTRRRTQTLFVPATAVVSTTLDKHVCCVKNGLIEFVPVDKGQTMGNLVEVFGKLAAGNLVVVNASEEIRPGDKVKPEIVSEDRANEAPPERPHYPTSSNN